MREQQRQQEQAVKAAKDKNDEAVKNALNHFAGMEEPSNKIREPRSSGGFDNEEERLNYVKSLGSLSVGQIKYLCDKGDGCGGGNWWKIKCATAAYPACTNKHLWRDLVDALGLGGNKNDLLDRTCGR